MDLKAGDELNTPGNGRVVVGWVRQYTAQLRTYNLSIDPVHTYYAMAGSTPVLVHNGNDDDYEIPLPAQAKGGNQPLTTKQAAELARYLGYNQKTSLRVNGQAVLTSRKKFS